MSAGNKIVHSGGDAVTAGSRGWAVHILIKWWLSGFMGGEKVFSLML